MKRGLLVSVRITATFKSQYGRRTIASRNIILSSASEVVKYLYTMASELKLPVQRTVFSEMAREVEQADRCQIGGDK